MCYVHHECSNIAILMCYVHHECSNIAILMCYVHHECSNIAILMCYVHHECSNIAILMCYVHHECSNIAILMCYVHHECSNIAMLSYLCAVRLWDLKTHTARCVYRGHNYPIWSLDTSPVGGYFVTSSHDRIAKLWTTDRVYPLRNFIGHTSDVDVSSYTK